jgi:hypothetical protein
MLSGMKPLASHPLLRATLVVLAFTACGDNKKNAAKHDGGIGGTPGDASVAVAACTPTSGSTVSFRKLAQSVVGGATLATSPPKDPRLFVIEQRGAIRIYDPGELLRPTPFLDISADNKGPVLAGGELGLLGLAFHPQYAQNGQFFVFYTSNNPVKGGDPYVDVLARYTASATDPSVADPASGTVLISISDPFSNHNGGMIEFGADGYLYIGTGDGGSAGDPNRNAQNPNALLGKFLRIDVDHPVTGKPYGIPANNPFAQGGGAPEVFMLGLRNPWRWSFDRGTGDLWIGDVGQDQTEELDVLLAGQQVGQNLGWSAYEGPNCCINATNQCDQVAPFQACSLAGKTFALDYRDHVKDGWNAIIGGQVYRGGCYPDLTGWYFYTDNGHGGLTKARRLDTGKLEIVDLPGTFPTSPSSLHADSRGELFLTDTGGNVFQLEAH